MILFLCVLNTAATASTYIPEDKSKAVILAYHRIGEDHAPYENLSLEAFQAHINDFKALNYNILHLNEIIAATQNNQALPPRTISITFDGAYKSAIQNAVPLLIRENIPFTIFYAADTLDQNNPEFASWKDLKKLAKNKNVTLATLPASLEHIAHNDKTQALKSINRARHRHREEFKTESPFLAYPFGEYTNQLKDMAKTQGFTAAFGLHSGAIYNGTDIHAIPRFSITEGFGDIERLRMVTNALPLPVTNTTPADMFLNDEIFEAGFSIDDTLKDKANTLSCFISEQNKPSIEIIGNRIEIRGKASDQNRLRLNCTLPGPSTENDEIQWRWFGRLHHKNSLQNEID